MTHREPKRVSSGGAVEVVRLGQHSFPIRGIPINKFGTRDAEPPDISQEKIVCLGCSHTFGHTRAENTYAKELERLLGGRFQVLNMGRRNYGLKLCIDWYHSFARKLSPEWCVVQVPLFCRQPMPELQADRPETYTMEGGSFGYLKRMTDDQFWHYATPMMERDLDRIGEFLHQLKRDEVKPVVLAYRTDKRSTPLLTAAQIKHFERLASLCSDEAIPLLSGDDLSSTSLKERGLLFDRTHSNEAGNRWIAYRIGQVIDSTLKQPRRIEIRNLAVDARSLITRAPQLAYRRLHKRLTRGKKRADSAVPTDTYTFF